ncbi:MAG: two pore domain potassium channel family protein [Chloroflexi bacterium]|nr:two pore domain potassium channel family protein [Chloroflexota bacterium]
MLVVRVLVFLAGVGLVGSTLISAIRTFVLPRGVADRLSREVFRAVRKLFDLRTKRAKTYLERDRAMALYAPVSLLVLPVVWLLLVGAGYSAMFWALSLPTWSDAIQISGSSLLTLGFANIVSLPRALIAFSEAIIGLGLVALLIAYLPTMYSAWSRREEAVALLEVRAGSPPSAEQMLIRYRRIGGLDRLPELWENWEVWFANIDETHTSLAALSFFRSPTANRSWITAAGAILDAAALTNAVVDVPHATSADLCLRAGYVALRNIARFFGMPFDPHPEPFDAVSVAREEFEEACQRMAAAGVPLKEDRAQAWRDFAGWRVNYDQVLIGLAALTMAPEAPWASDRSLRRARPPRRRLFFGRR